MGILKMYKNFYAVRILKIINYTECLFRNITAKYAFKNKRFIKKRKVLVINTISE